MPRQHSKTACEAFKDSPTFSSRQGRFLANCQECCQYWLTVPCWCDHFYNHGDATIGKVFPHVVLDPGEFNPFCADLHLRVLAAKDHYVSVIIALN